MEGLYIFEIVLGIVFIIVVIIICVRVASSGNQFRDNSQKITNGMTKQEVISIMGEPSFEKQHQDGSVEFIYEKSEWKGWLRGGTKTRRMEIVFSSDGIVISVGKNSNCDMTGW